MVMALQVLFSFDAATAAAALRTCKISSDESYIYIYFFLLLPFAQAAHHRREESERDFLCLRRFQTFNLYKYNLIW